MNESNIFTSLMFLITMTFVNCRAFATYFHVRSSFSHLVGPRTKRFCLRTRAVFGVISKSGFPQRGFRSNIFVASSRTPVSGIFPSCCKKT